MRPEHGYGYGGAAQRQGQMGAFPSVQKTYTIRNEVNLKKPTLRVVPDDSDPNKLFIEFTFDASSSCKIGVYYAAVETTGADGSLSGYSALHSDSVPPKETRGKGLGQKYRVPITHPLDVTRYNESALTWTPPRESQSQGTSTPARSNTANDRYPVIIALEAISSQADSAQSQTTFATLQRVPAQDSNMPSRWMIKPIKQKIQVGSNSYELQEIYGIDQTRSRSVASAESDTATSVDGSVENEDDMCGGAECVICMSETKDTTVLPCRHMCMCAGCARVLRVQSNRCPICRQFIDSLLQIKVSKPASMPDTDNSPVRWSGHTNSPQVEVSKPASGVETAHSSVRRSGENSSASA
mmetsp:Transcript_24426/g.68465  ORF Transcript_24426/g.68465 Transcript_24426/m.68465 type:complete len:354 (+) Transcript_24426:502-1563(+)